MQLLTNRCVISYVSYDDVTTLYEIFMDQETKRFFPELYQYVVTERKMTQFVETFNLYSAQKDGFLWKVQIHNAIVGFIAVMDLSVVPSISYSILPQYRHQGYMRECVSAVIHHLFKHKLCNFIQAEIETNNAASFELLKSIGFVPTNNLDAAKQAFMIYSSTIKAF